MPAGAKAEKSSGRRHAGERSRRGLSRPRKHSSAPSEAPDADATTAPAADAVVDKPVNKKAPSPPVHSSSSNSDEEPAADDAVALARCVLRFAQKLVRFAVNRGGDDDRFQAMQKVDAAGQRLTSHAVALEAYVSGLKLNASEKETVEHATSFVDSVRLLVEEVAEAVRNPYDILTTQRLSQICNGLAQHTKEVLVVVAAVEAPSSAVKAEGSSGQSLRRSSEISAEAVPRLDFDLLVACGQTVIQALNRLTAESERGKNDEKFLEAVADCADGVSELLDAVRKVHMRDHASLIRRQAIAAINACKTACTSQSRSSDSVFREQRNQAVDRFAAELRSLFLAVKAKSGLAITFDENSAIVIERPQNNFQKMMVQTAQEPVESERAGAPAESGNASEVPKALHRTASRREMRHSASLNATRMAVQEEIRARGKGPTELADLKSQLSTQAALAPLPAQHFGKQHESSSFLQHAFGSLPRRGRHQSNNLDHGGSVSSVVELGSDIEAIEQARHFDAYLTWAHASTAFGFRRAFELPGGDPLLTDEDLVMLSGAFHVRFHSMSGSPLHEVPAVTEDPHKERHRLLDTKLAQNDRSRSREIMLAAFTLLQNNVEVIIRASEAATVSRRTITLLETAVAQVLDGHCRTLLLLSLILSKYGAGVTANIGQPLLLVVEEKGKPAATAVRWALDELTSTPVTGSIEQEMVDAAMEEVGASSIVLKNVRRDILADCEKLRVLTGQTVDACSQAAYGALVDADTCGKLIMFASAATAQWCHTLRSLLNAVDTARYLETLRRQKRESLLECRISVLDLSANVSFWDECPTSEEKQAELQQEVERLEAGTMNALVFFATSPSADVSWQRAFLATFHSFMSAQELLDRLIDRFNGPPGLDPATTTANAWERHRAVQGRVGVLIKHWIEQRSGDFGESFVRHLSAFLAQDVARANQLLAGSLTDALDRRIAREVDSFVESGLSIPNIETPYRSAALDSRLLLPSKEKAVAEEFSSRHTIGSHDTRYHFQPARFIFSVSSTEVARQITLLDCEVFGRIAPAELLQQAWNRESLRWRSPNVLQLIRGANSLASWIGGSIVQQKDQHDRATAMEFWISVARELHSLRNFHSLMSVVSAFNMAAIGRLRHAFELVSAKAMMRLKKLEALMNPLSAYKAYRAAEDQTRLPAVPFLGCFLSDMASIDEGNSSITKDNLVNFSKRRLEFSVLQRVQRFQQSRYDIAPMEPVRSWVSARSALPEDVLYKLSLEAQPRAIDAMVSPDAGKKSLASRSDDQKRRRLTLRLPRPRPRSSSTASGVP